MTRNVGKSSESHSSLILLDSLVQREWAQLPEADRNNAVAQLQLLYTEAEQALPEADRNSKIEAAHRLEWFILEGILAELDHVIKKLVGYDEEWENDLRQQAFEILFLRHVLRKKDLQRGTVSNFVNTCLTNLRNEILRKDRRHKKALSLSYKHPDYSTIFEIEDSQAPEGRKMSLEQERLEVIQRDMPLAMASLKNAGDRVVLELVLRFPDVPQEELVEPSGRGTLGAFKAALNRAKAHLALVIADVKNRPDLKKLREVLGIEPS